MYLHENIHVTDWFYIYFTENNGMAFGLDFGGKLYFSIFSIVACIAILYYLYKVRFDKFNPEAVINEFKSAREFISVIPIPSPVSENAVPLSEEAAAPFIIPVEF